MEIDKELIEKLPDKYKNSFSVEGTDTGKRIEINIEPQDLCKVLPAVKDAGYDHFIGITVIDYPDQNAFELVYLIDSISKNGQLVAIRTKLPRDNPVIDTASFIYPLAYYQEIEAYEFFGIRFNNHDGLRKWILEDNWQGPPPLRKDVDTRDIVLKLYYGGKRYERPVQKRSLGGYSLVEKGGEK
ncbi:NADH-quinone oxidoreductase subunit C [Staphylothermus hellenicus]|uniref:NADH dehydrogenase (Ubiquinone) 30 kDa subunit n=1 Tax=Staphylothermus hellenicus (strain DSM 12710 / JCM 10830 / BK20S6-10-b1 / P8) TaxID=591019 RepID=D7DAU0_STAHD|nr:NADH-quinone oxidoreductase subunit C [Staphylothermus hellenicus]ADI31287.1 NADH dehydrogenase (ubiquinone) 30 kDa subunit [Staphylothermus hellenicus DSM 12710]